MTFTLVINTDNAAFHDEDGNDIDSRLQQNIETARILREVAERLEDFQSFETFQTLRDINGNDVGRAAFKDIPTYSNR